MTLANLIKQSVREFSDKVFLIDRGLYRRKEFTYKEIYDKAISLCGFFNSRKIIKGDKVLIYLPNSSDYGILLWACALYGLIAVPIDFNNKPEFVSLIYKKVKAKAVFCSVFKQPRYGKKCFQEELSEVYDNEKYGKYRIRDKVKPSDIFEIVYTSGTTAEPKGVVLTNANLVNNIESIKELIDFDIKGSSFLSILPLSHLFEQNIGFFTQMCFGNKIIYSFSRKSSSIIGAMNDEKIRAILTVPLFLSSIRDKIQVKAKESGNLEKLNKALERFAKAPDWLKKIIFSKIRKNLGDLEYLIVGGSALDAEVEKFWKAIGINVFQGYGLTETSPVLACNNVTNNKIGTVGKPVSGVKIKITKEKEIIAKGDNVFSGYYQNPVESKKVLKNGWLYTGDLGEIDKDGFLKITGRKKNMILSPAGLNIYPEDIEGVLNKFEEVKDCVVLGLDNGKKLVGVVLTQGKANLNELLRKINSKLPQSQYLSQIYKWHDPDFPRTTTLKVKRREVEAGLKVSKVKKEISADKLIQLVSDVCEVSTKKVKENNLLRDLGLDSIRRIELSIKIEETFNLDYFNEDEITEKATVKDLRILVKTAKEFRSESGVNVFNSKVFGAVRFVLQGITFLLSRIFFSINVRGIENIPDENVIFIANHISNFDTLAVYRAMPLKKKLNTYSAAAKDLLFEGKMKILGFLSRISYNAFAFSRETNIKQSLKDFGRIVNQGGNVLIFPEGKRSMTGKLGPFKPGIGLMAWHMEVPIVPIKIRGMYEVLPPGKFLPKFGKVKIKIGKPLKFSKMNSVQEITDVLHEEIEKL